MGRFLRAWCIEVLKQGEYAQGVEIPDGALDALDVDLAALVRACNQHRHATIRLDGMVLQPLDVAKVLAREPVLIGVDLDNDRDIQATWRDDDLHVGQSNIETWVAGHARNAYQPPAAFADASSYDFTLQSYFTPEGIERAQAKAEADVEAGKMGFSPTTEAPEFADRESLFDVTPYSVRRKDGGEIVLQGWWLVNACTIAGGSTVALSLHRDKVTLDLMDPEALLSPEIARLKRQTPSADTTVAPSNGMLHLVDTAGAYAGNIRLDAETVLATEDGRFVLVRRPANRKKIGWATLVLAAKAGELTPIGKLWGDIDAVHEVDGRVFARVPSEDEGIAAAFELLGIEAVYEALDPWTPEKIEDYMSLEKQPAAAPVVEGFASGEDLLLLLEQSDNEPPAPGEAPITKSGDLACDTSPMGDLVVYRNASPGQYTVAVIRRDGAEIDLAEYGEHPTFAYDYDTPSDTDGCVYLGLGYDLIRVELATTSHEVVGRFDVPPRDLQVCAAGTVVWALQSVNKAHHELARLVAGSDGRFERQNRFSVEGLTSLQSAESGSLVFLTIANAPSDLAYTIAVGIDEDGIHRYLGRAAGWMSACWDEGGSTHVQMGKKAHYRVVAPEAAIATAAEAEDAPFLGITYDVPQMVGTKEFFARYDADVAYFDRDRGPITGFNFTEAYAFDDGLGRAAFQSGRYFGLVGRDGEVVTPPIYSWIGESCGGLRRVGQGDVNIVGKAPSSAAWGMMNASRELVVPCQFASAAEPREGFISVRTASAEALLFDEHGAQIGGAFQHARSFREGLCPVCVDEKWGFIDTSGEYVIEPRFAGCSEVAAGLAGVKVTPERGWKYFRVSDQEFLLDQEFQQFTLFDDGVACVQLDGKWAHLAVDGEFVGTNEYARTYWFKGDLALVQFETQWNVVNREGKRISEENFQRFWEPAENIAIFTPDGSTYGFMNADGEILRDGLSMAHQFSDGLAGASVGGKFGFIDTAGEWVIEPFYDGAQPFSEGLACVQFPATDERPQRWGYIDATGATVIEPAYGTCGGFADGIAVVRKPYK